MATHTQKEIDTMTGEMLELFVDEGAVGVKRSGGPKFDGDTEGARFDGDGDAIRATASVGIQIGLLLASGDPTGMERGEQLQIEAERLGVFRGEWVVIVA
jgi:hypothetical protein